MGGKGCGARSWGFCDTDALTPPRMTAGELFVVGATHRTASLGLRERLALTAENEAVLAAELAQLPGLQEFVILNTCNRVEIYGVGANASQRHRVVAAFCDRQGFARDEFAPLCLDLVGRDALQHLLEVVSGIDSQITGENEIFGQVKKAYQVAQIRGATGPVLNRIFQKAFQAAKQARTETSISAGLVSVASVAVDLAGNIFGDLRTARVLLLGAGEIGLKSGRAFRSRAAAALTVASRRLDRAQEVAGELQATALPFDQAVAALADFDVMVCSTAAPTIVLTRAMAEAALRLRGGRPLFFIDLALPRDVDAGVGALENVFLYNLDDLAGIAAENRSARRAEVGKCQEILDRKADTLWLQAARLLQPEGTARHPFGIDPAGAGLRLAM
jgi:glutamyl-tRNA reductase